MLLPASIPPALILLMMLLLLLGRWRWLLLRLVPRRLRPRLQLLLLLQLRRRRLLPLLLLRQGVACRLTERRQDSRQMRWQLLQQSGLDKLHLVIRANFSFMIG